MPLRPHAIAILALAGLLAVPRADAATAADFLYATLPKAGSEPYDLPYRYLVPAGYNAANAYPLIVFLHGSGERGTNNTSQLNNNANGALQLVSTANQAAFPCFMIAPQANISDGWNGNTLPQVVRAIRLLESSHHIDHDRIYVTGLSMGGAGTCSIITANPTVFAAAVPMSGWGAGSYEKIVHIPQWFFHAANDGTVGVGGSDNAVSALRNLGCPVIYTRYASGGHGIWSTAYGTPHLLPWMMAQRRNRPVAGTPILTITSPASHIVPPPPANTLNVAGTVTLPAGAGSVAAVGWGFNPGANSLNVGSLTAATGTASWTAAAATTTSATLFLAVAEVPSWSTSLGGVTTLNDWLWNVPRSANTSAPTVTITAPSTTGSWTTATTSMTLSGTAAGASGKTIRQITWRNDRGGSGQALGTTAWSVTDLGLATGANVITVTARDSASITGTTTITVQVGGGTNTAPTISTIAAQSTGEDVAKTGIACTVGDTETAAGSLTLSGASSNTALVPVSGITFGGSGANRTVSVAPAADRSGTATITVTVSDGALTAAQSFTLTVNAVNDAPTISAIANATTTAGVATAALAFVVGDAETAAGSLTLSGASSNTALVPVSGIAFGGAGANRTVMVTPAATGSGSAVITVTVSDGALSANRTCTITVTAVVVADTTPPAQPAAPTVDDAASATPLLSGITEAGATITIRGGDAVIGTVVAGSDGVWTWAVAPPLVPGTHALSVVATDAAGNASVASPATAVVVPDAATAGGDGGDGDAGSCGMGSLGGLALVVAFLLCLRLGIAPGRRLPPSHGPHPGRHHG